LRMSVKNTFIPGEWVVSFKRELGIVMTAAAFAQARDQLREGRRPGRHFAQGCCAQVDYICQIPVLFEDGTYDVMRAMNLRRTDRPESEAADRLRRAAAGLTGSGPEMGIIA